MCVCLFVARLCSRTKSKKRHETSAQCATWQPIGGCLPDCLNGCLAGTSLMPHGKSVVRRTRSGQPTKRHIVDVCIVVAATCWQHMRATSTTGQRSKRSRSRSMATIGHGHWLDLGWVLGRWVQLSCDV